MRLAPVVDGGRRHDRVVAGEHRLVGRQMEAAAAEQTGGSIDALRARSALPAASHIHATTLILNGAQDDRTDPEQARRLAAAIKAGGGQALVHIYPDFGHEIPVRARDVEVTAFIDATLRR